MEAGALLTAAGAGGAENWYLLTGAADPEPTLAALLNSLRLVDGGR